MKTRRRYKKPNSVYATINQEIERRMDIVEEKIIGCLYREMAIYGKISPNDTHAILDKLDDFFGEFHTIAINAASEDWEFTEKELSKSVTIDFTA